MNMPKVIRLLIADDHQLVREGLKAILETHPDVRVVAEAENGQEAVRLARETKPDVVIMDVSMPQLNGIDATRRILSEVPETKIVALSVHSDRRFAAEMLQAGACGYVLKDCAVEELEHAVRAVLSGEVYLCTAVVGLLVEHYIRHPATREENPALALSEREREVLQCLAEGRSIKEIADLLHLGVKTVETHRQRIMKKLGLRSLPELTKYAIREGLTALDLT
jgi:DNA-binding NarL/FixJ family response regulator